MRKGYGASAAARQAPVSAGAAPHFVQRAAAAGPHTAPDGSLQAQARRTAATQILEQNRAVISRYFLDLRTVLHVTPHQAAVRIYADVATIEALEAGFVEHLPAWPETARIVDAYTTLAGLDSQPVLGVLAAALSAHEVLQAEVSNAPRAHVKRRTLTAKTADRLPSFAARWFKMHGTTDVDGRRPGRRRTAAALAVPLAATLVFLNTAAVGQALRPVSRAASEFSDFFRVYFAPVHNGHRWIEVSDPRSRRADKLRIKGS